MSKNLNGQDFPHRMFTPKKKVRKIVQTKIMTKGEKLCSFIFFTSCSSVRVNYPNQLCVFTLVTLLKVNYPHVIGCFLCVHYPEQFGSNLISVIYPRFEFSFYLISGIFTITYRSDISVVFLYNKNSIEARPDLVRQSNIFSFAPAKV